MKWQELPTGDKIRIIDADEYDFNNIANLLRYLDDMHRAIVEDLPKLVKMTKWLSEKVKEDRKKLIKTN